MFYFSTIITQLFFSKYPSLEKYYKFTEIDSSKQQNPDAHCKVIQKIIFTGNLEQDVNTIMLFIIEEP